MDASPQPIPERIELLFYATGDAGGELGTRFEEHDVLVGLDEGGSASRFNVRTVDQPDLAHLDSFLDDAKFRAVHLSAHGTGDGGIFAEGQYEGYRVAGEALARHFDGRGIDLVVLSVCGALAVAEAIAPYVGCVVAADARVTLKTMSYFNRGFYEALARGKTVDDAFATGCARASIVVGSIDHLKLIGDGSLRFVDPSTPPAPRDETPWSVCIIASPALAPICRRMAAHLWPHRTIYLGHDDDPSAFIGAVYAGLESAEVLMVLYEPDVYGKEGGEPIDPMRARALWSVRDQVIVAIDEKVARTQKRLFPVYIDGPPKPPQRHYYGLRQIVGLDVKASGGLARAMRKVKRMFLS